MNEFASNTCQILCCIRFDSNIHILVDPDPAAIYHPHHPQIRQPPRPPPPSHPRLPFLLPPPPSHPRPTRPRHPQPQPHHLIGGILRGLAFVPTTQAIRFLLTPPLHAVLHMPVVILLLSPTRPSI
ncbi:unnamed protein product [Closterium sp. NIES-53]